MAGEESLSGSSLTKMLADYGYLLGMPFLGQPDISASPFRNHYGPVSPSGQLGVGRILTTTPGCVEIPANSELAVALFPFDKPIGVWLPDIANSLFSTMPPTTQSVSAAVGDSLNYHTSAAQNTSRSFSPLILLAHSLVYSLSPTFQLQTNPPPVGRSTAKLPPIAAGIDVYTPDST